MATEAQIKERYEATHEISKQRLLGEIDLTKLKPNESIIPGDGETFFWLLTAKNKDVKDIKVEWVNWKDDNGMSGSVNGKFLFGIEVFPFSNCIILISGQPVKSGIIKESVIEAKEYCETVLLKELLPKLEDF